MGRKGARNMGKGAKARLSREPSCPLLFLSFSLIGMRNEGEEGLNARNVLALFLSFLRLCVRSSIAILTALVTN